MTFCAYIHCRPDGTPFYVGKSNTHKRAYSLSTKLNRNKHHENVVHKYGRKEILIGHLDCSTNEIALELEIGLIKCLKRSGTKLVNLTDGGQGSTNPAQYIRDAQSRANKGRAKPESVKQAVRESNARREWSKESLAKLSAAAKGRKLTPEHIEKVAAKHRGAKRTEETRAKIGEAMKIANTGKIQSEEWVARRIASRLATLAARKNAKSS
jgi:hypothetical protein